MAEFTLRRMTIDDVPAVAAIEHATFPMPWSEKSFRDEMTTNKCARYLVVVDENDVPVGFAGVWVVIDEGHITNIAVREDLRGKGLGRLLTEGLKQYAANPSFVGMKFLAGYHGEVLQPEYEYAMDFADEVGCPVLCHEWANVPDRKGFEIALQTRHRMKLIIAHQGGGSAEHTRACAPIITDHANAYMELCGSLENRLGVEDIVDLVGAEKVIFGTDAIDLDPKFELGKVAFSPLDDRIKKMIFAENYLSLLEGSQMGKISL